MFHWYVLEFNNFKDKHWRLQVAYFAVMWKIQRCSVHSDEENIWGAVIDCSDDTEYSLIHFTSIKYWIDLCRMCILCVPLFLNKLWQILIRLGWDGLKNELLIKTINGLKDSRRPSTRVIVCGNTRMVWVRLLSSISRPLVTELCVCYGQIYWAPCDRLSPEWLMILLSHIWPIKCPLCLWSGLSQSNRNGQENRHKSHICRRKCVCGVCGGCVCVFVFTHVYCT